MAKTAVLDHGYVDLVETWGSDERIVEAARMSTGKGFKGWGGFEPCPACQAAGATQSYNEMSARYTPLPDVNYVPSIERLFLTSNTNKQAQSSGAVLTESGAQGARDLIEEIYGKLEHSYQFMLQNGVPKELARIVLPVGRYSRMRASANLRNWLGFLTLRMSADAQWEIRQYANAVGELVAQRYPRTWALFCEKEG